MRDFVSANIVLQAGCAGAKPEPFCLWLFSVLGARRGDRLHDIYPGSGAVKRTWDEHMASLARSSQITRPA